MIGQAAGTEDIDRLRTILDDNNALEAERIAAGFSLGRQLDAMNAFDGAFAAYADANRIVHQGILRSHKGFDLVALRSQVDWLIETFRPEMFTQRADYGDPSDRLVFVVGMPRSGTTLVEQIAASHAQVFGAGERKDIPDLVQQLSRGDAKTAPLDWDPSVMRRLSADHVAKMTALAGGAARIIDKLPDNIQLLGQIALLFPNARIILCRRDLRDACLSAFFQQFGDGMSWTFDLSDCAARAQEIERLLAHWRSVIPLRMLEIDYEAMVADQETQSRRMIDFLDLDWDPEVRGVS